ncbi:MAG: lipopolysaccharide heptosyltransferase II [Candidatus Tectimicrobiota bacterium]
MDLHTIQRLLVIRLSSLGDILLTTPVLRLLRTHCPHARLEVLTRAMYADLLRTNPCVDQLHCFASQESMTGLLRRLRPRRYDLVLDLHRTLRSRLLSYGINAAQKLVYSKRTWRRALLVHGGWNTLRAMTPVPELYAAPLRRLGLTAPLPPPELLVAPESRDAMQAVLARALPGSARRPWLAVAPGARWPTKCWPVERFAAVAQSVAQARDAAVVILGGRADMPYAQALRQRLSVPVLDSTGTCTLMETAALLQQCQLLLANDSGLMHMATALRVPVVAVFGPTVQEFGFYPFSARARVISAAVPCRPCSTKGSRHCPRGHHQCMTQVTVEHVQGAVHALWTESVQSC